MKPKSRAVLGQISDMDLRLLRVFRTVVDCGGMAAAELELNIGTIHGEPPHQGPGDPRWAWRCAAEAGAGFALTAEGEQIYAQDHGSCCPRPTPFAAGVDEIHQRMGGQLHVAVFDKTASNPAVPYRAGNRACSPSSAPDVALNLHVATLNGD